MNQQSNFLHFHRQIQLLMIKQQALISALMKVQTRAEELHISPDNQRIFALIIQLHQAVTPLVEAIGLDEWEYFKQWRHDPKKVLQDSDPATRPDMRYVIDRNDVPPLHAQSCFPAVVVAYQHAVKECMQFLLEVHEEETGEKQ